MHEMMGTSQEISACVSSEKDYCDAWGKGSLNDDEPAPYAEFNFWEAAL